MEGILQHATAQRHLQFGQNESCCISYFAATKHLRKQSRKGKVYFGPKFKGSVRRGGERRGGTDKGQLVTLHPQSKREQ